MTLRLPEQPTGTVMRVQGQAPIKVLAGAMSAVEDKAGDCIYFVPIIFINSMTFCGLAYAVPGFPGIAG